MKSLRLSMLFLLLVIVVVGVHCYSTGAPASACSDIYPVGHLGTSQDLSTNPFQLSLSDFDQTYGGEIYYVPGQDYTLTLSGSGGEQFRGFLVQARALADGSPVGTFIDNGDDQTLSSCNPPESAITHMNNSLKSSVMLKWTAPLQKTREVQFLFSIVVQNSASNSTFYATARTKPLHSCGLPLYESAGHCVETCPDGQFGNGSITTLTGTCDPLPSDYAIALNATVYYAKIHIGQPLNTPVFRIRAFFNTTANIVTSSISLSQTGKINKLFEFEGGSNNRIGDIVVPIADHSVFDTSINLVQHPDTQFGESEYPVPLMIVISLNALLSNSNVMSASHVTSQGRGSIQDPCSNKPCVNGSCTPGISADYSCECFTGFTGTDCDENIDDCPGSECVNGTCVDGIANYTCDCDPGFNGTLCDQEINECHTADCNNGTCTDLVNDYMCQCYQDYTGQHCDTLLSCSSSPCENEGTCIDEEQGTFLCLCPPEWTGMTCGEDALPCDPNPCNNGGICSENGAEFSCNCAVGWTGDTCAVIDPICEEGDSERYIILLAIIWGLVVVIVLLCGLSVVGFMLASKNRSRKIFFRKGAPKRHESVASFDAVMANYNTSAGGDHAANVESQEEMWQFEPGSRMLFKPVGNVVENDRSSPTFSAIQYNLTLALSSEDESEDEEELSQESYES
ncbi:Protein eyes shut [Geodia barretti]|uniref:Protein eyes shut n=2 Tax=Geodia barretti TaxID=519541 RepID=A0AA35WXT1_GEOBA|nr:Protein eyes shut [Geodia barretti]